jgi:hypothetical protein
MCGAAYRKVNAFLIAHQKQTLADSATRGTFARHNDPRTIRRIQG